MWRDRPVCGAHRPHCHLRLLVGAAFGGVAVNADERVVVDRINEVLAAQEHADKLMRAFIDDYKADVVSVQELQHDNASLRCRLEELGETP